MSITSSIRNQQTRPPSSLRLKSHRTRGRYFGATNLRQQVVLNPSTSIRGRARHRASIQTAPDVEELHAVGTETASDPRVIQRCAWCQLLIKALGKIVVVSISVSLSASKKSGYEIVDAVDSSVQLRMARFNHMNVQFLPPQNPCGPNRI